MPTPQGKRSPYALDGAVPNLTWDDFLKTFQTATDPGTHDPSSHYLKGQLTLNSAWAPINAWATQPSQNFGSGEGGVLGDGSPDSVKWFTNEDGSPQFEYTSGNLGDGTQNTYWRGDNGQVMSHNDTINTDSWWDSTGLPLVATLVAGAGVGAAAAAGIGVTSSGEAIGATAAGAGGTSGLGTLSASDALGEFGGQAALGGTQAGTAVAGDTLGGTFAGFGADGQALQTAAQIGGGGAASGGSGGLLSSIGAGLATQPLLQTLQNPIGTDTPAMQNYNPTSTGNGLSTSQILNGVKTAGGLVSSALGGGSGSTANGNGTGSLINGLGQLAGGVLSASEAKDLGNTIVNTVDPFNQYRGQYSSQLNAMVQAPGYAAQFSPTGLSNYVGANPNTSASMQALANYQANPALAASLGTVNGEHAANAGTYGALNGVGDQYAALLKDPNSILQDKAYQAQTAAGQEAVQRALAQRGQTNSGNEQQALQDFGTNNLASYYGTRLNQLGTGYNQQLAATGQQTSQDQNAANLNLSNNQQAYNQTANTANTALQANQLGYNEQQGLFSAGLSGNSLQYQQLAQMSGLSQANLGAAGNALAQTYNNVGASYGQAGIGLGQILNSQGGLGGLFNTIGNTGSSLYNLFNNTNGSVYNPTGLPTDPSGNLVFDP